MRRTDRAVRRPRMVAAAAGACAALAVTACGGGDDAAEAPPAANATADGTAMATSAAPASSELQGCLETAGFTVQEGSTPAEVAESLGIEQQLRVVGPDEGVGSVTVYASMDGAEEALAAEQAADTPGVAIARMDTAVYVYSGAFDSEMAISKCLQ